MAHITVEIVAVCRLKDSEGNISCHAIIQEIGLGLLYISLIRSITPIKGRKINNIRISDRATSKRVNNKSTQKVGTSPWIKNLPNNEMTYLNFKQLLLLIHLLLHQEAIWG